MVSPFLACQDNPNPKSDDDTSAKPESELGKVVEFSLPPLGYAFGALEPAIDAMTMEIHHDKHHAGYVRKLNAALKSTPGFEGKSLAEILGTVTADQKGVRNNGGGHWNHSLFWEVMTPGGSNVPEGQLAEAINASFGDFDTFKTNFFKAAKTRFGSGWAWLSVGADKKLFVSSTPNQDNPLMTNITKDLGTPIMGIDVWEHAYYLHYQNKRGDYINAFTDLINWDVVSSKFDALMR